MQKRSSVPTQTLLCPCGKTGQEALERIRRGFFSKRVLFWLPLKKYRCLKCKEVKWQYDNRKWY